MTSKPHVSFGYVYKLNMLLMSRFERTLLMDADIYVLSPTLIAGLLTSSLAVADAAAPMDPGRGSAQLRKEWGFWHPDWSGPPPFCSCLLAVRKTKAVEDWIVEATRIILFEEFPHRVRRGDQEALYMSWVRNNSLALRLLFLPIEYFCPRDRRKGGIFDVEAVAAGKATWTGTWAVNYSCRAVHQHMGSAGLTRMGRTLSSAGQSC